MASFVWSPVFCVVAACFLVLVSGCSLGDKKQLKQCLNPIHPLLKQPDVPSHETCRTINAFIKCVNKRLSVCGAFISKTRVLEIANGLKHKYCLLPTTTTTSAPRTTPPPTVHQLFSICRENFKGRSHKTLKQACRSAGTFLKCGQSVLWPYDFSVETFYLHAELLRNRAVFWTHCTRRSLRRAGVGRGTCPYDVTNQLTSCINVTYWQSVVAGDIKTFCRSEKYAL
ncbi:hypothetical protein V1264_009952 [Littorina saxatilis]|uniref:Uncharacterized protein n=1 Tax=Littorina saxatilis TaxID=31220 RepID=A0AAN9G018_9CAEN